MRLVHYAHLDVQCMQMKSEPTTYIAFLKLQVGPAVHLKETSLFRQAYQKDRNKSTAAPLWGKKGIVCHFGT